LPKIKHFVPPKFFWAGCATDFIVCCEFKLSCKLIRAFVIHYFWRLWGFNDFTVRVWPEYQTIPKTKQPMKYRQTQNRRQKVFNTGLYISAGVL